MDKIDNGFDKGDSSNLSSFDKIVLIKRRLDNIMGNSFNPLNNMSLSDLKSYFIILFSNIIKSRNISDLFHQYNNDRFVKPSEISQKELLEFDLLCYSLLEDFENIELSPVSPLGINNLLTKLSPNLVLPTIRNTEVLADATTVLALELSKRRKLTTNDVNIATSHRFLRCQNFSKESKFLPHFRAFVLGSAGKTRGMMKFEIEHIFNHLNFYLSLLERLNSNGYFCTNIKVYISDIRIVETLINKGLIDRNIISRNTTKTSYNVFKEFNIDLDCHVDDIDDLSESKLKHYGVDKYIRTLKVINENIISKLKKIYTGIEFVFDLGRIAGIGYYHGICFKIVASNINKQEYPLVDGGLSDWTQKILSNDKERLLVSGIGTELFIGNFKR